MNRSFTLMELVVVIIIIAVLAALGFTQYNNIVEKSRLAEAMVRIGLMRTLTQEYYYKYGSLDGIQNSDVGAGDGCTSSNFYEYFIESVTESYVKLDAGRCTSGGKPPDASSRYVYYLQYYPATGQGTWHCYYWPSGLSCFGLPS